MTVDDEGAEDFRTKPRWSAGRKMDVVLRLLRGEKLEELSPELGEPPPPPIATGLRWAEFVASAAATYDAHFGAV
jgi:hypothetical protein